MVSHLHGILQGLKAFQGNTFAHRLQSNDASHRNEKEKDQKWQSVSHY